MSKPGDVELIVKRTASLITENPNVFSKNIFRLGLVSSSVLTSAEHCFLFIRSKFNDTHELREFLIKSKKDLSDQSDSILLKEINAILSHISQSAPIDKTMAYNRFKGNYGERIIFLHHHKSEEPYAKKLSDFLMPLEHQKKIILHSQASILAGDSLSDAQENLLTNADLIISFFSPHFLQSNDHLRIAKEIAAKHYGPKFWIPFIVKKCLWKDFFNDFQPLPKKLPRLTKYNEYDVFLEVAEEIRRILYLE